MINKEKKVLSSNQGDSKALAKRKYKRTFKVTWGGRPYKNKKKEGFLNTKKDIIIVDGVCVLEGKTKKPMKTFKKSSKSILTDETLPLPVSIEVETHIKGDKSDEVVQSLDESVTTFTTVPQPLQNDDIEQSLHNGISLIAPSMKASYDCVNFFIHHSGTTFTPISGMGYLYRNKNPFQTVLPNIAMRDPLTFSMIEEFAKVAKATHILRKNRINNHIVVSSSSASNENEAGYNTHKHGSSVGSRSNNIQDLDIESYTGISSTHDDTMEPLEGKMYDDAWLEENGYDEFFEEKQIVKNFKNVYKKFEIDAFKRGAQILLKSKISNEKNDKKDILNTLTSLLMLLVFYSYFGKHNKNVKLIVGTCKELLYLLGKMNRSRGQIGNDEINMGSKILITSEHNLNNRNKAFTFDDHNFFNPVKKIDDNVKNTQMDDEREIQFLSNWTNYSDILTAMTIIPEKTTITQMELDKFYNYSNSNLNRDHYTYEIEESKRLKNMNELKDIEYFSGVDLQNIKYMNELTDLLLIKDEIDELESDLDPLMILNFENQCMRLSVNMEKYLKESEAQRDTMILQKTHNIAALNVGSWFDDSLTKAALQEYEQLRTVNKVFALISILQVHRRLLNRLTDDNHVKHILSAIIELLEHKVPYASAAAQCLFGSIFIVGCELGNIFIDESKNDELNITLRKGKGVVLSHLDYLVGRGLVAAERAKDVINHVWLTNSLNSTYKNWWVILKENDINIHLSL
ncbi:hypothetical protein ACO0R3_000348 [Hanseniaspora guilliermondii]